MSNYTETQLNAMNKTSLVSLAIELGLQLASFQSGPLKGSDVEKTMLDLARQAANIKSNDDARKEAHELALAKIESDKEIAIRKLELDFADSRGLEAAALEQAYATIEEKSKLAIDDLTFGLKKAELANKEALEKLDTQLTEAKEKYATELATAKEEYERIKTELSGKIAEVRLNHTREMEQLLYDNKIALRDENLKSATTIAAIFNKTLVDDTELEELKSYKAAEEAVIEEMIAEAVATAKKELYATEGAKYSALKSSTDSTIALLTQSKTYLEKEVENLNQRIVDLNAQIVAFPGQLKDAVEAAKADVTINQDNKK